MRWKWMKQGRGGAKEAVDKEMVGMWKEQKGRAGCWCQPERCKFMGNFKSIWINKHVDIDGLRQRYRWGCRKVYTNVKDMTSIDVDINSYTTYLQI